MRPKPFIATRIFVGVGVAAIFFGVNFLNNLNFILPHYITNPLWGERLF